MEEEKSDIDREGVSQTDTLMLTPLKIPRSPTELSRILNLSRDTIHKHLNKLMALGWVEKDARSLSQNYIITEEGRKIEGVNLFSYGTTIHKGVHDIILPIPIADNSKSKLPSGFWDKINNKLKNSVQRHKLGLDFGISLRETSRHIVIQITPQEIRDFNQVFSVCLNAINYVYFLLLKYDYILDPMKARLSNIHFTLRNKRTEKLAEKGSPKTRIYLGRPRTKIFDNDPHQEAWVERCDTPVPHVVESNDKLHMDLEEMMPEMVNEIRELVRGSVSTQNAIANTQMMMASVLKTLVSTNRMRVRARKIIERPLNWWLR